jgi:hypothetical protein
VKRLSVWFGAGVITAGVSAALLAGAGVAGADAGSGSSPGGPTSSGSAKPDTRQASKSTNAKSDEPAKPDARRPDSDSPRKRSDRRPDGHSASSQKTRPNDDTTKTADADTEKPARMGAAERWNRLAPSRFQDRDTAAKPVVDAATALRPVAPVAATPVAPAPAKPAAAPRPSVVGLISSAVFNVFSTAERLVNGPPTVPAGSTVTVRSSSLEIGSGLTVPADWYYPAGDKPPNRMILLQHGFLAIGPMYSYTAANLAERTNSIVVTPTLTSNPLADGALWLGGAAMHEAVADLFVGNRDALTASAVAAGYADRYHLDPAEAALPRQFALAGHSAGGALVSAVAGYLADNGAAADLAGVILLDGVPTGDQLSGALVKLDAYEAKTGRFIPVREIGAPLNVWNFPSNANEALSAARPNRFVGVVLDGGVHMDSMQGGNPLIQFVAYLAAGFPQPQNPPAVQELSVTWLNQWFNGSTGVGDNLLPGSTITIDTPSGPASAVVIGNPPAVTSSSRRLEQVA